MNGRQFKQLYKALGYQQREIAEELGITSETVRQLDKSKGPLKPHYVMAMAWLAVQPHISGLILATNKTRRRIT